MSAGIADKFSSVFDALGSPVRLSIMRFVLSAYPGGITVGEIQKKLNRIAASTLSHHLEKLKAVGLVRSEKEKQWIWVFAEASTLRDVLNFLYGECCQKNQILQTKGTEVVNFECCPKKG